MKNLKPCPLCGSKNVESVAECGPAVGRIQCYDCGLRTRLYRSEKDAIKDWNTRADIPDEEMKD